jgi:type IV secretion system protein VirD4
VSGIEIMIVAVLLLFAFIAGVMSLSNRYNLNNIKNKTVGNGQHGTARWATKREIRNTYRHIDFKPDDWRENPDSRPTEQGIVVGCKNHKGGTTAMVDTGDVHALMIGAAGVGKTAYWLYPCIEYTCATGMSFLTTDTKGDLLRNYGTIAEKYYDYKISVIDLRNPTRSNGNNLLHLVNKYMDLYKEHPEQIMYKAKCEKYAKIISKTIIMNGMEGQNFGQNSYFYDSAEGLLTATILLVSEFCKEEERHIVSVYKIIQELLAKPNPKSKSYFQQLMELLPENHKAKWFAGSALNSGDQSMASVMSTALSRLNAFLDSELEQLLCFDTELDAEEFCHRKSAIFVIMPEEDPNKFFMVSLIIQQLYREILAVADENGGKLENRCVFFCDEFGTLPKIESAEMMFSASRSRRLQIVPIIQSFAQLEKNYGKEGADVIIDNTQLTIFGGFAPNSTSAEVISKALGSRTVMSGSVSRSKDNPSQSIQMIERPLMTPDELKNLPKGTFVVMKTAFHPMKVKLKLFFKWGINFEEPYMVEENGNREVHYANRKRLFNAVVEKYSESYMPKEVYHNTPEEKKTDVKPPQNDEKQDDGVVPDEPVKLQHKPNKAQKKEVKENE